MALSTLLRSSLCMNRALGSQALRVASRPTPVVQILTRDLKASTPILNAVRALRTSAVNYSKSDHSKLWVMEKAVSALFIPLVPLALMYPNKVLDSILAIAIVVHTFWGFEAIAVDYVRPILFGPVLPKVALALVYAMSFVTLGGLFYIIQHDIGIANTIRQIWSIKAQKNV